MESPTVWEKDSAKIKLVQILFFLPLENEIMVNYELHVITIAIIHVIHN